LRNRFGLFILSCFKFRVGNVRGGEDEKSLSHVTETLRFLIASILLLLIISIVTSLPLEVLPETFVILSSKSS